MQLRDNNFYCTPAQIEDDANGKVARIAFPGVIYLYDLPEEYWCYFVEDNNHSRSKDVDFKETRSKDVEVKEDISETQQVLNTNNTIQFKNGYYKTDVSEINKLESLHIQAGFGRGLKKIDITDDPIMQSKDLLKFILDFILCENSIFVMGALLGMSADNKEAKLWELYKAYYAKLAVDNVSRLVHEENERLGMVLESFGYDPLG